MSPTINIYLLKTHYWVKTTKHKLRFMLNSVTFKFQLAYTIIVKPSIQLQSKKNLPLILIRLNNVRLNTKDTGSQILCNSTCKARPELVFLHGCSACSYESNFYHKDSVVINIAAKRDNATNFMCLIDYFLFMFLQTITFKSLKKRN